VRRRRLIATLERALDHRVTLVTGPPGSGKTTTVAQWARSSARDVVWIDVPTEGIDATAWRKRIDAAAFPTIVVCDGLDALAEPLAIAELDAFCDDSPAHARVVLIGRSLPLLPSLIRLRLAGEVHDVTEDELRCRDAEAIEVLAALGVDAGERDRKRVLDRTEGLMAAVVLATTHAGSVGTNTLSSFDGSAPEIAQYLYTEIVDAVTLDVFGFMLATSVFDVLDPTACDEVVGRTDAAAVLAELTRAHLLTERLADGRTYRYHSLLRDFLRAELRQTRPSRWTALHRSAAAYYERTGDEDRALHHWIDAGEVEEAWSRFRRRVLPNFFEGELATVEHWTQMLPPPPDGMDVSHALDMALALVYMGDVERATPWCRLVDDRLGDALADVDTAGRRAYLEFLLVLARGDFAHAARLASTAHQLLAASSWSWDELRAPYAHAMLQALLGRVGRARVTMSDYAARANARLSTDNVAGPAVSAQIALAEGALAEARALAVQSLGASHLLTDPEVWFTGVAHHVLGTVLLEQNRIDEARRELGQALELADKQGFVYVSVMPALAMARVQHYVGDDAAASDLVARCRTLLDPQTAGILLQSVDETDALLAIAAGNHDRAHAVAHRLEEPSRARVLTRLLIDAGELEEAQRLFAHYPQSSRRDRIELLLLRARCAGEGEGLEFVRRALALAEADDYVRIFVDEASWLDPVIRRLVGRWPSSYVAEIAAAIVAEPDRGLSGRNLSSLSEREQEVWRFLSTSLSMQEIAAALYVSRNTLKSHVRSIYRKLGVGTREAAVGRGRTPRASEA
jgi:LuxR family maltose regulon positive regulatory protein